MGGFPSHDLAEMLLFMSYMEVGRHFTIDDAMMGVNMANSHVNSSQMPSQAPTTLEA